MKLRYSPTSPFVRKVLVCAAETGQAERIEIVPTNHRDPHTDLPDDNPLGKIPALVTDAGERLFDSRVICEYLDSLHDGARLFPAEGEARWRALRIQALADGILDAGVACVMERFRAEHERSVLAVTNQKRKIARAVDALEGEAGGFGDALTIATIATGCAMGYLDFRLDEDDWRAGHPTLSAWYEGFAERPSMIGTVPRDPA